MVVLHDKQVEAFLRASSDILRAESIYDNIVRGLVVWNTAKDLMVKEAVQELKQWAIEAAQSSPQRSVGQAKKKY